MEPAVDTAPARLERAGPIPRAGAKALILFNEKAGSVRPGDRLKLTDKLAAAGVEHIVFAGPERIQRAMRRAGEFDVVIVLGGDGTARAAAEHAPRDGPPLLILPGGTLNILPRALLGERDWPDALEIALEQGIVKRLTAARANGEPFFVAAAFGAPTLLARAREAVREGRLLLAVRRFRRFLRRSFARSIRARPDRQPMRAAEAVGVLCPSFSGEVEANCLEWVRLDARHLLDLARVSVRAMTEGWRKDPSVEIGTCRTGDIVSLGLIPATLDGEPRTFVSRVRITFDPKGPRVIVVEERE
jgi:diacylglycerol kinase family enzyme